MSYAEVVILGDAGWDRFISRGTSLDGQHLYASYGDENVSIGASNDIVSKDVPLRTTRRTMRSLKTWAWGWFKQSPLNACRAHLHCSKKSHQRRTSILELGRRNLVGEEGNVVKPKSNNTWRHLHRSSKYAHMGGWCCCECLDAICSRNPTNRR